MTQPKLANPTVAPKVCPTLVRKGGTVQKCGTTLRAGRCSNRENHLLPFESGFCNSGWHEGHKINKPTCKFWVTCPCECHTVLSKMAEMAGTERSLVDNSTFQVDRGAFVRVSLTEATTASLEARKDIVRRESPAPGIVPVVHEKTFAATPSGRAGRGELESWVAQVTGIWAVEGGPNCTPQYVSESIARTRGITPPSSGAVDAVFKRWQKIGFATIETKPTRFTGYTPEGIEHGLEVMKAKARR